MKYIGELTIFYYQERFKKEAEIVCEIQTPLGTLIYLNFDPSWIDEDKKLLNIEDKYEVYKNNPNSINFIINKDVLNQLYTFKKINKKNISPSEIKKMLKDIDSNL
jgi:hypothetical protein